MAKVKDKSKGGQPTKYKNTYPKVAYKLCLLGMIDKELAKYFEVTVSTLTNWKKEHPKFLVSIKEGRIIADAEVTVSLYKRATGAVLDDVHISNYQGVITKTKLKKNYPPDVRACEIWLTNRQRKKWTESPEAGEEYKEPIIHIGIHPTQPT